MDICQQKSQSKINLFRLPFTVTGFILFLVWSSVFLISTAPSEGANGDASYARKTKIYLFWGDGCPHCEKEKIFLKELLGKYPEVEIREFEVWYNKENAALFEKIIKAANIKSSGVPATLIGRQLFIGFDQETGRRIEEAVRACIESGCDDALDSSAKVSDAEQQEIITLPLFGKIDTSSMSLPVFTLIIGGLDSFNPCAFFVLLFLLSLLVHAKSRKRMLLIGGIFVFFSGFIYFLFMAAWLNIFMIIGQVTIITAIAAVIALVVALINIKDFFFFKKGVSLSIPEKAKPKLFDRMRGLLKSSSVWTMITGTIMLAITANFYELLCTAGFPMVYTRVLTLHNLSSLQYYLYLVLYNIVYVVPLAVIVIIVTISLGAKKLTEWQGRKLKLVSGLMMFFLGLVLLVKPALLNNVLTAVALLAGALISSFIIIVVSKKLRPDIASG